MSDKGLAKAGRVWYANSSVRMSMVGMSIMSARRGGWINFDSKHENKGK